MYNYHPCRLAKSSTAKQNLSHRFPVVCNGSPSRMRRVRRISLGMTMRPRSSTRRTMPVAFIIFSPCLLFPRSVFAGNGVLCGAPEIRKRRKKMENSGYGSLSHPVLPMDEKQRPESKDSRRFSVSKKSVSFRAERSEVEKSTHQRDDRFFDSYIFIRYRRCPGRFRPPGPGSLPRRRRDRRSWRRWRRRLPAGRRGWR